MLKTFSKLFFETVDPKTEYKRLFSPDVAISIIFHSIFYLIILLLVTKFTGMKITGDGWKRITLVLLLIMISGYFGRLYRSKSIYKSLMLEGNNENEAREKTKELMKNAYFVFYFFA